MGKSGYVVYYELLESLYPGYLNICFSNLKLFPFEEECFTYLLVFPCADFHHAGNHHQRRNGQRVVLACS